MRLSSLLLAAMLLPGSGGVAAQRPAPDPGRAVAASCASCHGTNGASAGVFPALAGRPRQDLVAMMREFRSGQRDGTVMPQLAKGYTEEQIELAAAWFAAQPPPR